MSKTDPKRCSWPKNYCLRLQILHNLHSFITNLTDPFTGIQTPVFLTYILLYHRNKYPSVHEKCYAHYFGQKDLLQLSNMQPNCFRLSIYKCGCIFDSGRGSHVFWAYITIILQKDREKQLSVPLFPTQSV